MMQCYLHNKSVLVFLNPNFSVGYGVCFYDVRRIFNDQKLKNEESFMEGFKVGTVALLDRDIIEFKVSNDISEIASVALTNHNIKLPQVMLKEAEINRKLSNNVGQRILHLIRNQSYFRKVY